MKAKHCLAVVVLCAVPMFGQTGTGNELIKQCGAVVSAVDRQDPSGADALGLGYCLGLVEGEMNMQATMGCKYYSSSVPADVTGGQAIRVVYKYLQDHPKDLHLPDFLLVAMALADAWPEYTESQKPTKKGSAH